MFDSVNGHVIIAGVLIASGLTVMAFSDLWPAEIGGAIFGLGLARIERVLEKTGDKQ